MIDQNEKTNNLERLWMHDGVWYRSGFARKFLKRARAQYPAPQDGTKAAWPADEEGISQNLTYFFTGHMLKMNKILSSILADEESIGYLSQAREITIIDMACGAGMAGIAFIDFIQEVIGNGIIQRQTPLTLNFVVNDLDAPCVLATKKNLDLAGQLLANETPMIHIGSIQDYVGSISGLAPFLNSLRSRPFDFLFFCNAFDHVLMYGHKALEKDPHCTDPIAHARPCDRPALLAKLLQQLGTNANPYFSRNVFMRESRHCHLISVALPTLNLKVTHTWMNQETDRPDVETPTMNVRFGYCVSKFGFSSSTTPELQPIAGGDMLTNSFAEENLIPVGFDDFLVKV